MPLEILQIHESCSDGAILHRFRELILRGSGVGHSAVVVGAIGTARVFIVAGWSLVNATIRPDA